MKLKIRLEDWNGTSVMQVLECDETVYYTATEAYEAYKKEKGL